MVGGDRGRIRRHLGRLFGAGTVGGMTEGQLLRRFAAGGDEVAFEALLARHGPMVLGVCRGLLRDPRDVEDAFQATFLVLVRKASALGEDDRLGPWLYGVARRVAAHARADAARRQGRERIGVEPESATATAEPPDDDLGRILHEELGRLPERDRAPVVLCYLEGLTHEEAARRLGWPVGTVKGRLSRARDLLRSRLVRRGVAPAVGSSALDALGREATAAVPEALFHDTIRAALSVAAGRTAAVAASAAAIHLAERSFRAMVLTRLMRMAVVAAMLGLVATGAGMLGQGGPGGAALSKEEVNGLRPSNPPAPPSSQPEGIQGWWRIVDVTHGGVRFGDPELPRFLITPGALAIPAISFQRIEDLGPIRHLRHMGYLLDPSGDAIDLRDVLYGSPDRGPTRDSEPDRTLFKGIYELKGDRLTICLDEDPKAARPTGFAAPAGTSQTLVVYRRDPPPRPTVGASEPAPPVARTPAGERAEDAKARTAEGSEAPGGVTEDLRGEWLIEKFTHAGISTYSSHHADIEADIIPVPFPDAVLTLSYRLAPSRAPGAIELWKPGSTRRIPGIYELHGDRLWLCFDTLRQERPTEFAAPLGTSRNLVVYRRIKPALPGSRGQIEAEPAAPGRPRAASGRGNPPADGGAQHRAILKKLDQTIPISFPDEEPLENVLEYIRAASRGPDDNGIPIYVDPIGLQEAEKTMQSPVSLDLEGVPLRRTLAMVLRQLGLVYGIKDGLLVISSREGIYDVLDPGPVEPSPLRLQMRKAERGELTREEMLEYLDLLILRKYAELAEQADMMRDPENGLEILKTIREALRDGAPGRGGIAPEPDHKGDGAGR